MAPTASPPRASPSKSCSFLAPWRTDGVAIAMDAFVEIEIQELTITATMGVTVMIITNKMLLPILLSHRRIFRRAGRAGCMATKAVPTALDSQVRPGDTPRGGAIAIMPSWRWRSASMLARDPRSATWVTGARIAAGSALQPGCPSDHRQALRYRRRCPVGDRQPRVLNRPASTAP